MNYSVGIVTFVRRFDTYFKPLLSSLKAAAPELEVLICINGEKGQFDQDYRRKMLEFLQPMNHVYPMFFTTFRSLSKLWNTCLMNASNDNVLQLNDDVTVTDPVFWPLVQEVINRTGGVSFKLNGSWSHICLNRREVAATGWFDERFLGVGEEDGDMQFRLEKHFQRKLLEIDGFPLKNHVEQNDTLAGMRKVFNKYSAFNTEFARQKYVADPQGESYGLLPPDVKVKIAMPDTNALPYEEFFWTHRGEL